MRNTCCVAACARTQPYRPHGGIDCRFAVGGVVIVLILVAIAAAAVALAVPALFHTARAEPVKSVRSSLSSAPAQRGISLQGKVQLLAFCAFEA